MNKLYYIIGGTIAILLAGWYGFIYSRIDRGDEYQITKNEPTIILAGDIVNQEQYDNMQINKKYSYQDFSGQDLTKIDPKEFNDTKIVNSNFYQYNPYTKIFPDGMTGVVFYGCNLDNVSIPNGNYIYDKYADKNTNKQFKEQNDGEFWIVDDDLNPIEPFNKKEYEKYGLSIDPKDIPTVKVVNSLLSIKQDEENNK